MADTPQMPKRWLLDADTDLDDSPPPSYTNPDGTPMTDEQFSAGVDKLLAAHDKPIIPLPNPMIVDD